MRVADQLFVLSAILLELALILFEARHGSADNAVGADASGTALSAANGS